MARHTRAPPLLHLLLLLLLPLLQVQGGVDPGLLDEGGLEVLGGPGGPRTGRLVDGEQQTETKGKGCPNERKSAGFFLFWFPDFQNIH